PSLTSLLSSRPPDGQSWLDANRPDSNNSERINGGLTLDVEASSPFPNSLHPGGVNVFFCDGSARFVRDTINGIVWAKLITPAGNQLDPRFRQLPVASQDID